MLSKGKINSRFLFFKKQQFLNCKKIFIGFLGGKLKRFSINFPNEKKLKLDSLYCIKKDEYFLKNLEKIKKREEINFNIKTMLFNN